MLSFDQAILDLLDLSGNDRQDLNIDSVELVEATPETGLDEAREDLAHKVEVYCLTTIGDDTSNSETLCQIFDSLSLAGTSGTFRSSTVVKVDGTAEGNVATIRQWRDHKSGRVTQVLVVVVHLGVGDLDEHVTVFPVVAHLRKPGEVLRTGDSFLQKLVLDDFFCVHIEHDKGLESASLQLGDVLTDETDKSFKLYSETRKGLVYYSQKGCVVSSQSRRKGTSCLDT